MSEDELKIWNRALALRLELDDGASADELGRKVDQVRLWAQRLIYDACPDDHRVREAQSLIRERHPWIDGSNLALIESRARFEAHRDGKATVAGVSAQDFWRPGWEGNLAAADWAANASD